MTIQYPANIDLDKTIDASGTLYSNNHAQLHQDAIDAIIEIEKKVGKDDDTNTESIDYKLSSVNGTAKAESQANKGIANGYVPLNASARISQDYLPTVIINSESTGDTNYVGDTTPLPSGATVSYDDILKTVTITLDDGSYKIYSETGIKEFSSTATGNQLVATTTKTGTYDILTHSITYTDGVKADGVSGNIENSNSEFAYKNKDNTFEGINTFNNDIIINGKVSQPYNFATVNSGILLLDGKLGHHMKVGLTGTSAITLNFKNATPGVYVLVIVKSGGSCSFSLPIYGSKSTGGASNTDTIGDTSSNNQLLGFYKSIDGLTIPTTLATDTVYHFTFEVFDSAIHTYYNGRTIAVT